MTELKTLKDIETGIDHNGFTQNHLISIFELKQEVIKWIKGDLALFEFGSPTWKFIMHFFNITEEDLK
jgi:hypothetical protein